MIKSNTIATVRNKIRIFSILHRLRLQPGYRAGVGCLGLAGENIFSVFRICTKFWTRGFPLVMRSRKAGLPLATRTRKREPCPEVRIENDSDQKFSKSQFFHSFGNHFSPRFMFPCHCEPKIYFRFFEVCTYPSIHNFGLEASPL